MHRTGVSGKPDGEDQSKEPRGVRLPGDAAPRNCHKRTRVSPARARKKGGAAPRTTEGCTKERPA